MRKNIYILLIGLLLLGAAPEFLKAGTFVDSLTTPDPNIRKYFPRWRICENDMKIQIHQSFLILGYEKSKLDMSNIEVLAAPRTDINLPYEILTITCGKSTMNSNDINNNLAKLLEYINGAISFTTNLDNYPPKRDYCYSEIPPETPVNESQAKAILSYMEPTNVDHAVSLSLFEQNLKIGSSGFWIKSTVGNDPIGYPFWNAGETKIVLKRPLYINEDEDSKDRIPNLVTAYLGGGYRITAGLDNSSGALSWISKRTLNSGPTGKLVAGFDFHMPFMPEAGIAFNLEVPLEKLQDKNIDSSDYGFLTDPSKLELIKLEGNDVVKGIAPILRGSGQVTMFYNWWLDKEKAENYFRFDLGVSYAEVREMALLWDVPAGAHKITTNATGLKTYKNSEFADWMFAKVEYRNQASYPFGMSLQVSNQIMLGKIYLPIFSWLYVEGKYATPLRTARVYESENFFMISPVIRITL